MSDRHVVQRIARSAAEVSVAVTALIPRISLIAIDGVPGAGKSTLREQLAKDLGAGEVDLDDFLIRNQGKFVDALRMEDLAAALTSARRPIVASGICMLQVLHRLKREPDALIYVKRMAIWGWADADEVEGSQIEELAAISGLSDHEMVLELEVRAYHRQFMPQEVAQVVFERPPAD